MIPLEWQIVLVCIELCIIAAILPILIKYDYK